MRPSFLLSTLCVLMYTLVFGSCGGKGGGNPGGGAEVPCDESFRGRWVRMDGGAWNVGDTKVRITGSGEAQTLAITAASETSFSVGSLVLSRVNEDLLQAAGGGQSFYLYRGGETGGFSAWVTSPAVEGSRVLGQGGAAGVSLVIQNVLDAQEKYEDIQTDANGAFTVPGASSGNIYSVMPLGGGAVQLSTEYGGQMAGTVFLSSSSDMALPKASLEMPANQPFIFDEGFRWQIILRITNQGGASTTFSCYKLHWQANEGASGAATNNYVSFYQSDFEGYQATPVWPYSGNETFPVLGPGESTTIGIWVSMDPTFSDSRYAATDYIDANLVVTLSNGDGTPQWEDSVPVRFYKNPLVITASAQADLPFCLISSTGLAHQFYFKGPVDQVSLTVPRAERWCVGISGAGASAIFKYSLGVTYPSLSADVLGSTSIATNSFEPNNSVAAAIASANLTLPAFDRIESWLGAGDIDFYEINVANPAEKFPLDEVFVQGGTFTMGEGVSGDYNGPAHQVTLSSFYITATELTVGQFIDASGIAALSAKDQTHPALTFRPEAGVPWYGAAEICDQYSRLQGLDVMYGIERDGNGDIIEDPNLVVDFTKNGWRLPTEAEWEYAARGGIYASATKYAGSDSVDEVAWYGAGTDLSWIHVVGMKNPNALGLYDMSGNMSEWVNDWYPTGGGYAAGAQTDPTGPSSGTYKTLRGGGAHDPADKAKLEIAARDAHDPGSFASHPWLGMRMVRKAP